MSKVYRNICDLEGYIKCGKEFDCEEYKRGQGVYDLEGHTEWGKECD